MNLRVFITIVLIGFLSISCGMSNTAILYFNDGKEKRGVGKIISNDQIKFKTKDSKIQKYHFRDLKRVKIYTGGGPKIYVRIKVKGKEFHKVLEEVSLGRVNLYQKISEGYVASAPMGTGFGGGAPMMGAGHYYSISNYYVRKENEIGATHLGSTSLFTKNFKKAASTYFSDCPSLVSKIQSREFKKRHLREIVEFYNEDCK